MQAEIIVIESKRTTYVCEGETFQDCVELARKRYEAGEDGNDCGTDEAKVSDVTLKRNGHYITSGDSFDQLIAMIPQPNTPAIICPRCRKSNLTKGKVSFVCNDCGTKFW